MVRSTAIKKINDPANRRIYLINIRSKNIAVKFFIGFVSFVYILYVLTGGYFLNYYFHKSKAGKISSNNNLSSDLNFDRKRRNMKTVQIIFGLSLSLV